MTEIQFLAGIGFLSLMFIFIFTILGIALSPNAIIKINGNVLKRGSSFHDKVECDSRPISKAGINYKSGYLYLLSPDKMWEHSYMLFKVDNIFIHINQNIKVPYIVSKYYYPRGFYICNYLPRYGLGLNLCVDLDIYLNSEKELEIVNEE
ncbi:MAG: hypothetical protein UT05_C0001G0106 [Parcubacteria group bacterium GW2011_GWF2_38_76]|nr:MAG: hypothetical protein UT05_C0001G0106 [Parcubacteria group bacterium GW2011_GWF2_38_76]HBM45918.1 hypothetical protein [Patescibacteria group bacterium]